MDKYYAFVSEEYYEVWAKNEIESGRLPTKLRFIHEFGTPNLYYSNGYSKELNYIPISSEEKNNICINFNYYSDLSLRYPNVVTIDLPETNSFIKRIDVYISKLFSIFSKRSTVTPISS